MRGNVRGADEMVTMCQVVIDVDEGQDPQEIIKRAREYGIYALIHSTHSNTPEHLKFRVIVPLDSDVAADLEQWPRVVHALATLLGADYDKACKDVGRLFYYPRHPADQTPWWLETDGRPVSYADLLAYADVMDKRESRADEKRAGAASRSARKPTSPSSSPGTCTASL